MLCPDCLRPLGNFGLCYWCIDQRNVHLLQRDFGLCRHRDMWPAREHVTFVGTFVDGLVGVFAEIDRMRNAAREREYDPNVAPCDDAEFGMEP